MTVTVASFRTSFLEFADGSKYPKDVVTLWLDVATKSVNADRWGDLTDIGISLYTAHQLALERRAVMEADKGAIPGGSSGPINNKSVDKVSVGYDTASAAEADGGHWNLTTYGTRYLRLARQMGLGALQIGVGCGTNQFNGGSQLNAGAWVGPWLTP